MLLIGFIRAKDIRPNGRKYGLHANRLRKDRAT